MANTMTKPTMLKVFGGIFLLVILLLLFSANKHSGIENNRREQHSIYDVASGDTNNETLRTIVANQQKLEKENKKIAQENEALRKKGLEVYQAKFDEEKKKLEKQYANQRIKLEEEIVQNKSKETGSSNREYPIKEGDHIENDGDYKIIGNIEDISHSFYNNAVNGIPKAPSLDRENTKLQKPTLDSHFEAIENNEGQAKYYTIPSNSTLAKTTLMTNIIGEVPVSGHLVEPAMPFKAIIGKKDLLASNGITLPTDLGGIVVSGYSIGNMSLSCTRMYVTQMLFTFNDGSFVVYPEKSTIDATEIYPKDALGYLSDQYGNVCLTGQYITDAPKVLASLTGMSTVSFAGQYVAQSQTTTYSDADSTSTTMTGDLGKYALGSAIGNGSQVALKWYTDRVKDIFDAVYLPKVDARTGQLRHLVFNATQTIPIDINNKTRKIQYDQANKDDAIHHDLD